MATQATKWQAILTDGTKLTGGTNDPSDVNVSAVPAPLVKLFTISHTTFSDTMYISGGVERWYHNGRPFTQTFPAQYLLADGTTLTLTRNSDAAGDLTYTQQ
jgi:hypothetical protein